MSQRASIQELREQFQRRLRAVDPPLDELHAGLPQFAPSLEEEETVRRFVALFENHQALSSRLLQAGGVPAFNPARRKVDSLPMFMRVLGLTNAKQVASCLVLAQAYQAMVGAWSPEDLRLCMLGGLLGREIVGRQGSCDPELGWVCGLLRSAGRLMMGRILEEDAEKARRRAFGMQNDDVTIATMGIAPSALTYHLWRVRALPSSLERALDAAPAYRITTAAFTHEDELLMWTDLALRLSGVALHCGEMDTFSTRVAEFLEQESATHDLEESDIRKMINRALSELPSLIEGDSMIPAARATGPMSDSDSSSSAHDPRGSLPSASARPQDF
ncbi:MAG: HDOD domain-containing protein [Verrucomicrobia bacterium]|nr:HDOD domain-containing protein [Verrucomicrobiota bacterium]MBI3870350.1 HDOD domain-containing protein [Verrucomicrobiota bacterium]